MINRQSRGFRAAVVAEHRVLGAAFLGLIVLAGWFTYAVFDKTFAEYDEVTLRSSKVGLQLPDRADVKVRGVIVGEVIDQDVTADGATLTLGLHPDRRARIPADVSARILPKTIFGEKYVALEVPDQPSRETLSTGDVIAESKVAMEVERLLEDIYPFLRAVQPAELNYTLTAMATALEGRGEQIGNNLAVLDEYLAKTNAQLPALIEDLRMLSEVSDTYRAAVPELARLLRNSVTTGNTFITKEQKIQAFFTDVAGFSGTSREFLEANGDNMIRLSRQGAQQLPVYAKYAPEYPCLLQGIVKLAPRQAESFRGKILHINLETLPRQPRGFGRQDDPVYGDKRGPHDTGLCRRAISDEWHQGNLPPKALVPDVVDGVDSSTQKERPAPVLAIPGEELSDVAALLVDPITTDQAGEAR